MPVYLALGALLVGALVLALDRGVEAFALHGPWSYLGAFALLVAILAALAVPLRLSALAALAGAPFALVAIVILVNAPLGFMAVDYAQTLPRAPGESGAVATLGPISGPGHPSALLLVEYPPGADLGAVTNGTAKAFRDAGWSIPQVITPDLQGYGLFAATKGPLAAQCGVSPTAAAPAGAELRCTLAF